MTVQMYETSADGRHLVQVPQPEFTASDPTGGRLVAWASGLSAAHALGTALCSTAFVPTHFKNKPEECAAAILYGDEVGLTPMQSLASIFVISGKPALYARAMVAVVLAAGHEVWTVSTSDKSVTVCGKRRGSARTEESTWTYDRARKAGYTSNKKYESDPQSMLYARAASDICRRIAPDALAGLAYSAEELELDEAAPTVTVTRAPRATTTAKRAAASEPVEPSFDDSPQTDDGAGETTGSTDAHEAAAQPAEAPSSDLIARSQMTKVAAQMGDLGITKRQDALDYVSAVVGRVVESRNELTRDEAHALIEHMGRELGEVTDGEES
jgi:hypothetical protein